MALTTGTKICTLLTLFLILWSLAAYNKLANETAAAMNAGAYSFDHKFDPLNDDAFVQYPNTAVEEYPDDLFRESTPSYPPPETAIDTAVETATTPIIKNKVAMIVEDRPLNNLVPLVLHFASVLGPSWPVIIYTSAEQAANLTNSTSLSRWSHQIGIRQLPENTSFAVHDAISKFLTEKWVWEDMAPADHVLVFQADSIICANADKSVDDFLEYDFVGAPVAPKYGEGYNGGLSIRNRNKVLDLITEHNWWEERGQPNSKFEDQWFYKNWRERPDIKMPPYEIAQQFAVETMWYDRPLGYHQIKRWQSERVPEVEVWCPEIKLTIGSTFTQQT